MISKTILEQVEQYYTQKLMKHGPSPQGVDWNSAESQEMRFIQLLRIVPVQQRCSINDYGCGYGGLLNFLQAGHYDVDYTGLEISEAMIAQARRLHPHAHFVGSQTDLPVSDYTVASGVFNVRLAIGEDEWRDYTCAELLSIRNHSSVGFAFNILTSYSDPKQQRCDLYYADPLFFFDFCKRNFSGHVALYHDYPLYEFTIAVRL